ncbi:MAG: metallophosphoesterase [Proteobacteria bacterium]|nr:MAG: metallophosphoesterase [Pseudomonadota bacterium]
MIQDNPTHYDIIGDIHGYYDTLISLFEILGYEYRDGCYRHPSRKAVFVGDFIDRGPKQIEVIDTVRAMMDAGQAYTVMGNHEFNAIAYVTEDRKYGGFLRRHSERNRRTHQAFLDAMAAHPERYDELITWMKSLPLWLDLGEIRIVHACWDPVGVEQIQKNYMFGAVLLMDDLVQAASDPANPMFEVVETLLKGKTIKLGDGASYRDSVGIVRHYMRVRWWDADATTYKAAFIGPPAALSHIQDDPINGDHLIEYGHREKPLFIGHYWMQGTPMPLAANIACVDYSVARQDGHLCAYRWGGEAELDAANYVTVPRLEP